MDFLTAVETGSCVRVAQQLTRGQDPNVNYLGVTPLSMAIECGDVDMVALLLNWKADPELAYYKGRTPLSLASSMAADEKCKLASKAAFMKELMSDPEAVTAHLEKVKVKVAEEQARDKAAAVRFLVTAAVVGCIAFAMYIFVRKYPKLASRDREL